MSQQSRFAAKTILLSGATGGLGRALAMQLAQAGAKLLLTARSQPALAQLAEQLPGQHGYFAADISRATERQALCDWAIGEGVDGLINNAGCGLLALAGEQTEPELEQLLAVNLQVPIALCNTLLPTLKMRSEAVIINIGSILGSIGLPGSSLYGATKAGLQRYSEALRRELSDSRIAVFYCAPRAIATPLNSEASCAMNRQLGNAMDSPDQVAAAIIKRCQTPPRSIYLGWPEKLFVRINALAPRLVDGALRKQLATIKRFAGRAK